jgi:hypothetical protein
MPPPSEVIPVRLANALLVFIVVHTPDVISQSSSLSSVFLKLPQLLGEVVA